MHETYTVLNTCIFLVIFIGPYYSHSGFNSQIYTRHVEYFTQDTVHYFPASSMFFSHVQNLMYNGGGLILAGMILITVTRTLFTNK